MDNYFTITFTFCLAVRMSGTGSVNSIPSNSEGLLQVETPESCEGQTQPG